MRILYLSQYFPPEVGATQTRAYEMAQGLLRAGHQVTMLAEVPNHPEGIIRPEYRGKFWVREPLDGIDVIRVWVKTAPAKTFKTRMAFYLSYMLNAVLAGLLLARGRYDAIYATSPPLFVGAAALALSRLRRIPLAFEVRDLWPESAVALGELHNPRFIRWATTLEEACYRHAQRLIVVTEGMRDRLIERGIPSEKLALIPNGANTELFQPQPAAGQQLRADLNLEGKFLIVYAGIHGIAQGLETALYAANQLRDDPRVHFLFIGEGPRKAELLALKAQLDLPNATMLEAQPREAIPAYLTAADVALIPLRRLELFKGAVPSKIFDAWACACPVLMSIDGEARAVLERAQGGVFFPPEDVAALVSAIEEMAGDQATCRRMGENGRQFVAAHYSRQAQAGALAALLENLHSAL
ncbi:MAG: glycosyltransferase family 4 protein [Anaerolineae bacterium]|jgi:glycosyltransferase involved in cell wall biosynthesis|nr:glycosyltransferase family 4 protein [Anaerolineae bacterium]